MTHTDDIERTLDSYRDRIGLPVEDVATPALVLDVEALERNIAAMEQRTAGGAALRPHAKAHKSAEIAGLQLRAGASGIMTATAWEALALARAGVTDILVGNVVRGAARCAAVAGAARHTGTTVLIDDAGNADELAAAARHAGVELDVLVDVDVGQHRTGARTPGEAVELARHVARTRAYGCVASTATRDTSRSSRTRIAGARALPRRRTIGRRSSTRSALTASPSRSSRQAAPACGTRPGAIPV